MSRVVYSFIILLLLVLPAHAEFCKELGKRCSDDKQERVIDGFKISRPCWEYEYIRECHKDDFTDYCRGIRDVSGCEQISNQCESWDEDGKCAKKVFTYQCGNLLENASSLSLLDSEYTISKDELDESKCEANKIHQDCQEIENVCIEGAETRNINGKNIYKECWQYEKKYSCFTGSLISNCEPLKQSCIYKNSKCLSEDRVGQCKHREKTYECLDVAGVIPSDKACRKMQYCVGEKCEEVSYAPNQNMGLAIGGLSLLANLGSGNDFTSCKDGAENCPIFKGKEQTCKINPRSARNCCKDKGWLKEAGLVGCNESEKVLAVKKEKGLCHKVGSYCSNKKVGVCLEKKETYCCFDSKIARIVHEQGRAELGMNWGTVKAPNCSPITITQLQQLDLSKIDFSEMFGDIFANLNMDKHSKTIELSKESVQSKVSNIDISQAPLPTDHDVMSRSFKRSYDN